MQIEEPIRILSDVHYGHPASLLERPEQLLPLFAGMKTVVFNGDTVEMRFLEDRPKAECDLEDIGHTCLNAGVHPIFVNGNHDPMVSSASHLDLADGAVLVTHGDLLFHDISPWSSEAQVMGDLHTKVLSEMEEDAFHDFEKRLFASKRAALALELHKSRLPQGPLARLVTYAHECWPPWRPFQIIKVWFRTPGLAVALARVFRPRARFIAIGHTHFAGMWRMGPRVVINTGSFVPGSGCRIIEIDGGRLTVRRVIKKAGAFHPGKQLAQFETTKLRAHEGF